MSLKNSDRQNPVSWRKEAYRIKWSYILSDVHDTDNKQKDSPPSGQISFANYIRTSYFNSALMKLL